MKKIDLSSVSPMMKHYLMLKEQYSDCILLFRLGDFYEMFFDDAETASKALDITLTGRDCGLSERAPMCGVPYHSVDGYIAKLIDKGYRVAICEQLTEAGQGKGMVERDVVRIITPGTLMDETMLVENINNYIAAVFIGDSKTGVAWADISTGEFYINEFDNNYSNKTLEDILSSIKPREIISDEAALMVSDGLPAVKNGEIPEFRAYYNWAFDYSNAVKRLMKQFNVLSLDAFEISDKRQGIAAAGALVEYLLETQKRELSHINRIRFVNNASYMFLDSQTRRNLELFETIRERKKKGSLLWLIDKTVTNMGGRKIRKWLEQPLTRADLINIRLDAVEELIKRRDNLQDLINVLSGIRDLERLAGKIAYGSLNPRDCISISESLSALPGIKTGLSAFSSTYLRKIYNELDLMDDIARLLTIAISPDAPALVKDGGFIRDNYNAELDELRNIRKNGEEWIAKIESTERELTGIKNLKVGYNRVFGYYIDVPKSAGNKVPYRYIRKQTLANSERYITDELKNIEDKVLNAEEKAIALENRLFNEIKEILLDNIVKLQHNAELLSALDALQSFATLSVDNKYVKPAINDKIGALKIIDGRHPVVEAMLNANEYIANDTLLDNGDNATMIITGPNMAGKSTYMRQVALITLLAHIGCFVSAKTAEIPVVDRIFTRVGASDDVAYGQSTFMVEMLETSAILNYATSKSLLILDEIGRGTSTYDGLSIAWAVMEYINSDIRAKTMFATHYHELTELEGSLKGVKNYRILVNEHKGGIVFLRKIVRGGTNKSFGIEVASLAGVPEEVIKRAKQISKALEANDINRDTNGIMLNALGLNEKNLKQLSFIQEDRESEIVNILKDINTDNISPMQAFMILSELVEKAKK
ncbi:MAG: DNA mismatch repair protein MutS [Christensenellales bacterium]|jgi:DNA mismatch repair protein MutS